MLVSARSDFVRHLDRFSSFFSLCDVGYSVTGAAMLGRPADWVRLFVDSPLGADTPTPCRALSRAVGSDRYAPGPQWLSTVASTTLLAAQWPVLHHGAVNPEAQRLLEFGLLSFNYALNPRPTGTPDFPPPNTGGRAEHVFYLGSYWS